MRGLPGVVEGIGQALPIFHECGIYPAVNLGINRHMGGKPRAGGNGSVREPDGPYTAFKEAFRKYYRFVIDLGFTMVNACYPMSIDTEEGTDDLDPVYAAASADGVVRFAGAEKALLFKALMEVIPEFRDKIRIFSPRTSLLALHREYSQDSRAAYPCRGGVDFFFVDSRDGNTYPCGYRGSENMGKFWDLDRDACAPHASCKLCDWECFRDPSELLGPVLQGLSDPRGLLTSMFRDPEYFRVWAEDLKYHRACDFFDGRRPPNLNRLRRFAQAPPVRARLSCVQSPAG
jgi:hypothetical protein